MRKRPLGNTGLLVSELGLGTWGLSGDGYGPVAEAEQEGVIERALALGITLFETADSYALGGMEKKLGIDYVRYWSSNIPLGYGERSVPRTKIVHAIFSRLDAPSNLSRIAQAPNFDSYLASLERVRSSYAEAKEKCGM